MASMLFCLMLFLAGCTDTLNEQSDTAEMKQQHELDIQQELLFQTQEVIKYVDEQEKLLDESPYLIH